MFTKIKPDFWRGGKAKQSNLGAYNLGGWLIPRLTTLMGILGMDFERILVILVSSLCEHLQFLISLELRLFSNYLSLKSLDISPKQSQSKYR